MTKPDYIAQPDFSAMRAAMVDSQLRTIGVTDPALVAAITAVSREDFVPEAAKATAYVDAPIRVGSGRYINPPSATGMLLSQAEIGGQSKVMVVGAAAGYCAAIAARLANSVTAVESDADLAGMARENLNGIANVSVQQGALEAGAAGADQFDVVLIDGAVEQVPDALTKQLADSGVLVCGVISGNVVYLSKGKKIGGFLKMKAFAEMDCVPLPGFAKERSFSF